MAIVLIAVEPVHADDGESAAADVEVCLAELNEAFVTLGRTFHRRNLKATRDTIAKEILSRDPDQPDAREWLGYRRDEMGAWKRSPRWKPGVDRNRAAAKQISTIWKSTLAAPAGALWETFKPNEDALTPGLRARVLSALILADSRNADYRTANGEVHLDGRWVLKETRRAVKRRKSQRKIVQSALERVREIEDAEPFDVERRWAEWRTGTKTADYRVLSTGSDPEAIDVVRHATALETVLRRLLRDDVSVPKGVTIMLLRDDPEKNALLERMEPPDDILARLKRGGATWITPRYMAIGFDTDPGRLDASLRMLIQRMIRDSLGLPYEKGAWLFEGFGIYLTHAFVGTRLCYMFGGESRYDGDDDEDAVNHLTGDDVDWLLEAHRACVEEKLPELVYLMGVKLNDLTPEDALMEYAFAAYMVEGREEPLGDLIGSGGDGGSLHAALETKFGTSLPELDKRVRRWLRDYAKLPR